MPQNVVGPEALPAFPASDARLARLRKIVDEHSLMRGDFTLSSGRKSNYLFQLRQTTMHAEGGRLVGELVIAFMRRETIRCVGGKELGAVPMVAAANAIGPLLHYPVSAFFVRKAVKMHGAKELVDGHLNAGEEVLAVDDVTTTGQSVLDAIDAITDKGCKTVKALSIVDREEGAAANLAARGITLYALFKRSDFKIE